MSRSFKLNDLRQKFCHVFIDVLKLPVRGVKGWVKYSPEVEAAERQAGDHAYSLSEWSPGDGRTRYRIEDVKTGREITQNMSLQEMRHFLDGIIVGRELVNPGSGD